MPRTFYEGLSPEVLAWFKVGARLKVDLPLGRRRREHRYFSITIIRPEEDAFWVVDDDSTSNLKFQVCELFWFQYVPTRLERIGAADG